MKESTRNIPVMEKMLIFLTALIKERGYSTEEFLKMAGFNKSQFYRGVKEPQLYFKDSDLLQIARVLDLGEEQKEKLFAYKSTQNSEQWEINEWAGRILHANPYKLEQEQPFHFEYYEPYQSGRPSIHKWSVEMLAERVISISENRSDGESGALELEISIYNCYEDSLLSELTNLFLLMEQAVPKDLLCSVSIFHYLNLSEEEMPYQSLPQRMERFCRTLPLLANFRNYRFVEQTQGGSVWSGRDNLCLIKSEYIPSSNVQDGRFEYFLLNLNKKNHCYMTSFDEKNRHLYDYLKLDVGIGRVSNSGLGNNSINVSAVLLEGISTRNKIKYEYDLCFDDISTEIWEKMIWSGRIDPVYKEAMAKALDPQGEFPIFDTDQILRFNMEYIGKRYEANESTGAISIQTSVGLTEFAAKGYFYDLNIPIVIEGQQRFLGEQWAFDPQERIQILEHVKEHLGKCEKGEFRKEYYLLKPAFRMKEYYFCVFQNAYITTASPQRLQRLVDIGTYYDKEVASAMFSYFMNEVIGKQGALDSILMSDEEARRHIEFLIEGLRG